MKINSVKINEVSCKNNYQNKINCKNSKVSFGIMMDPNPLGMQIIYLIEKVGKKAQEVGTKTVKVIKKIIKENIK